MEPSDPPPGVDLADPLTVFSHIAGAIGCSYNQYDDPQQARDDPGAVVVDSTLASIRQCQGLTDIEIVAHADEQASTNMFNSYSDPMISTSHCLHALMLKVRHGVIFLNDPAYQADQVSFITPRINIYAMECTNG